MVEACGRIYILARSTDDLGTHLLPLIANPSMEKVLWPT